MTKRLFIDTNIMLDLLGERAPFYQPAAKIATLADSGELTLIVSALSYSTCFYVLSRYESSEKVIEKLRKFKTISEVSDLSDNVIDKGLASKFTDFEDALQYFCALKSNCEIIVTRNGKDFKQSELPVMSAEEFLASLKNK